MSKQAAQSPPRHVSSDALPRRLWLVALIAGTVVWNIVAVAIGHR